MLMMLVLRWDQDGEYAGADFIWDIIHDLAVRTACVDTTLTLEIGSIDATSWVVRTPVFLIVFFVSWLHIIEQLSEDRVAKTMVHLAIKGELSGLMSEEIDFNLATMRCRLFGLREEIILQTTEQNEVNLTELCAHSDWRNVSLLVESLFHQRLFKEWVIHHQVTDGTEKRAWPQAEIDVNLGNGCDHL